MSFRAVSGRLAMLAILITGSVVFAFSDTIRLKDGGILKGKIVAFSGGRFTLAVGEGSRRRELTLSVTEIESIEFEETKPVQVLASNTRPSHSDNTVAANRGSEPAYQPASRTPEPVEDEPVEEEAVETVEPANPQPAKPQPSRPSRSSSAKPVELSVKVLADNTANGWTNSGWVVKAGQKIRISASGEVNIGGGKKATPSGLFEVEDDEKLLKNVPTGALIAVIGDDNNEFIYIGSEREFVATRDGSLFLGLNEGDLDDNSGAYQVKIEIIPDSE